MSVPFAAFPDIKALVRSAAIIQLILKLHTGQTLTSSLISSPIQKSGKKTTRRTEKTTQPAVDIFLS